MSFFFTPRPFTKENKQNAVTEILKNTVLDCDFYLLVIGAILLAAFGIFLDSIVVLIASMIVAPLAYPILGLGLGIVAGDKSLMKRSTAMLAIAFIIAIGLSAVLALMFGHIRVDNVLIGFSSDRFLATAIAVISGVIAAYGLVRPKVGAAITGIGIAVSLMPPLVAMGIGLATQNSFSITNTFIIFMLNVVGILAGSSIVFAFLGIGSELRIMQGSETKKHHSFLQKILGHQLK